ncbi:MAG: phosphoglycerol transferase I [Pseudoxanthomonas sp.]
MPALFAVCVLALIGLLLASRRLAWAKAGLLSLLLLALSAWWAVDRLSGDGINAATLYHLQSGLEGAGVADFRSLIAAFGVLVLLSLLPLALVPVQRFRVDEHGGKVFAGFVAVFVLGVFASPLARDGLRLYQQTRPVNAMQVAAEYVTPTKPLPQRKNIVWIYGESLERTYLDAKAFPSLMPNLTQLAGEALDFRDIASPEGSGWTIAGLVASQCGVPLTTSRGDENSMGRLNQFLPGAHCLGDYLKRQGYAVRFSGGADAGFAAKGDFLASHGFDVVKDQRYFQQKGVAKKHFSDWGVHDDVLLDDVFDDFMELSASGQPFLLSTLTMDTHHPAGHLPLSCRDVRYDSEYGDINLLRALKCSDRLVSQLVEKIRNSKYADNTLVVIASDHLAMPNDLSDVLADLHRENLLLFLDSGQPPRQIVAKAGSTLDSGATLLQLMDPAQRELGFGRSLLAADTPPSASAAALADNGARFPLYLGYGRQLWTGTETRTLRVDDDAVRVGLQRIKPPVLLEYDRDWNLRSVVLNDAPRQFIDRDPDNVLAYVDRCTAFIDDASPKDWCAALWDHDNNLMVYDDAQLQQGVQVDAPLAQTDVLRPRPRRSLTLAVEQKRMRAGNYQLLLRASQLPTHPFWLEAVSAQGKVVHAREWVQPDALTGDLRLPVWLDAAVDGLEVRAWLDYTESFRVERVALVRQRGNATAARG